MKDISFQDFDLSRLYTLSLYELRNFARALNVPRPTTYNRDDLITAIVNRIMNKDTGIKPAAKSGRKPKVNNFDLTKVMVHEESYLLSVLDDDYEQPKVRSGETGTEKRSVSGFVHLLPKGGALVVGTDLNAYSLPVRVMANHKFAMGDFIECTAVFSEARQIFIVDHIISKERVVNFETVEGVRPHVECKLGDIGYKQGGRVLVSAASTFDRVNDIAKSASEYSIALLMSETDDSVKFLADSGINEVYLSKVNYNLKKQTLASLLCMFRAKQAVESGNHVTLFIDSLTKLFKTFNNSAYPEGRVTPGEVVLAPLTDLKTFFMSARAIKNGGSLTVVAYINNPENDVEEYLLQEFSDLANVIIKK